MILFGAEVNSEIEAAAAELRIGIEPASGAAVPQGATESPAAGAAD
jgi:hypothetical protein